MSKYRVITDQGAFDVTTEDSTPTLQEAVGPGNDTNARNFALATGNPLAVQASTSDPVTNLKALPAVLGTAGALSPIPGGATIGTVGGRQLSNEGLRLMGRSDQIPSTMSQVGEGALSVLGDAIAIPAIKKAVLGPKIGAAETLAGLGDIEKTAPPSNVRTAIKLAQQINSKGSLTPEEAKALKPAMDSIWQNGWLSKDAYKQYAPDVADASGLIQKALNSIPGRAAPAAEMAGAMTIPNMVQKVWSAVPRSVKYGMGVGTGAIGTGDLLYQALKKVGITH